jgi:hypothetical protein
MLMKDVTLRMGSAALAAGGALALGLAPAAQAQQPPANGAQSPPTGFAAFRSKATPPTAQFEDTATQRRFVLERRGGESLLKFEDSPEVMVLRESTAQRGDAFLRTETGRLVLRLTELGNVISYVGNANGAPAEAFGAASPLNAPPMPASLADKVKETAERLSTLSGQDVTVFGAGAFARDEQWAADALMVLVLGVSAAEQREPGSASQLRAVRMLRSEEPELAFAEGELVMGVDPADGYGGRPSSDAIANALTR